MAPLSYHLYGTTERPVLVLLHAYPLDSRMWDGVISHLHVEDPELPILTVDAPGFGDSPEGPEVSDLVDGGEEPSLETYAKALEATLSELQINEIVLAGLSLGGYAALAYAEEYPERIRGLGLLDTKAEADEEPARKVRLATAAKVMSEGTAAIEDSLNTVLGATTLAQRPDVVEDVRSQILAAPPAAVAWIQKAMASRPSRLNVLERLDVPAVVVRGDEDSLSSAQSADAMATALRVAVPRLGGVGVVTLPGVGHMSANEAPDQVAGALADLYARVAAS